MRHIGVLAVSAVAILAAGTLSAEAFGGHGHGGGRGYGGFGAGLGLAAIGAASAYGYGNGYGYGGWGGYPGYAYGDSGYGNGAYGYPGAAGYAYSSYGAPNYSNGDSGFGNSGFGLDFASPSPQYSPGLTTGRSAAYGGLGKYCSTPVKSCLLYEPSSMGAGCSCKVSGGRARGNVTP